MKMTDASKFNGVPIIGPIVRDGPSVPVRYPDVYSRIAQVTAAVVSAADQGATFGGRLVNNYGKGTGSHYLLFKEKNGSQTTNVELIVMNGRIDVSRRVSLGGLAQQVRTAEWAGSFRPGECSSTLRTGSQTYYSDGVRRSDATRLAHHLPLPATAQPGAVPLQPAEWINSINDVFAHRDDQPAQRRSLFGRLRHHKPAA